MKDKKVLVVGGGGRCHAIVDAFHRSDRVGKIYCAPGNAGMEAIAECVPISTTDVDALLAFALENNVDLTVVGPEAALAEGIVDRFREKGLRIFGPTKAATRIESSKEYAKEIMMRHGVPTAGYEVFSEFGPAWKYVSERPLPAVIKYDGLAAGKGVVVAETYEDAENALRDMLLDKTFGQGRVVIEDFLSGPEFSFMCLVNGRKVYPLALAQDHKRAFDGDKGPNTGGMGAYSPLPFISEEVREKALKGILQRTADAMADEGVPFTGVLYGGLILTADGPKVIEFNARFGDPETEVVLPRLKSDFYDFVEAVIDGKDYTPEWNEQACLGIVMAAKGYPGSYKKGAEIKGADRDDLKIYHMGTRRDADGRLSTAGGRVMMVVGFGDDIPSAREEALRSVEAIDCPDLFYRRDIGHKAL